MTVTSNNGRFSSSDIEIVEPLFSLLLSYNHFYMDCGQIKYIGVNVFISAENHQLFLYKCYTVY